MDNVIYAVTVDLDEGENTTYDLGVNFPNELITDTSHTLQLTLHDSGAVYDISSLTASTCKIKKNDSSGSAVTLATGTLTTDGTDGRIDFVINKDLIPASLAAFQQSPDRPVVLYFITIEDANSKIQVRKLITVFDIDGTGNGSANPPAADIDYTPTTPGDWTPWASGGAPTIVEGALDDSAEWINDTGLLKVTGPSSATDNAIMRFDLTTGKLAQDSNVIIDDSDNITGVNSININSIGKLIDKFSDLALFSTTSGHKGLRFGDGFISPIDNVGTTSTGDTDLGSVTAEFKNIHLGGNIIGLSNTFTPTFTNFTIGNGTIRGVYQIIDKVCHFTAGFTMGSTSAITGNVGVTGLPVTSLNSGDGDVFYSLDAVLREAGVGALGGYAIVFQNDTEIAGIKDLSDASVNATTPFTWGTNDVITISGSYPTA